MRCCLQHRDTRAFLIKLISKSPHIFAIIFAHQAMLMSNDMFPVISHVQFYALDTFWECLRNAEITHKRTRPKNLMIYCWLWIVMWKKNGIFSYIEVVMKKRWAISITKFSLPKNKLELTKFKSALITGIVCLSCLCYLIYWNVFGSHLSNLCWNEFGALIDASDGKKEHQKHKLQYFNGHRIDLCV